jgi:hypothetical protein
MAKKAKIEPGHVFGRMTVIREAPPKGGRRAFELRCQCGRTVAATLTNLRRPRTTSCGCYQAAFRHGGSRTSEYKSWRSMIARCTDPTHDRYADYGGKGVVICQRWLDAFSDFLTDMGRKPTPRHTIDRIDNSRGYEPGNCRWASKSEQASNRSTNRIIQFRGKSMTLAAASREIGMRPITLQKRLDAGWPVERAMTEPLHYRGQA